MPAALHRREGGGGGSIELGGRVEVEGAPAVDDVVALNANRAGGVVLVVGHDGKAVGGTLPARAITAEVARRATG